jgi:hypothetical protein
VRLVQRQIWPKLAGYSRKHGRTYEKTKRLRQNDANEEISNRRLLAKLYKVFFQTNMYGL